MSGHAYEANKNTYIWLRDPKVSFSFFHQTHNKEQTSSTIRKKDNITRFKMGVSQADRQTDNQGVFISGLHAAYPEPVVDNEFLDKVVPENGIANKEQ